MVILDENKKQVNILTEQDLIDYVGEKCGDAVKEYLESIINDLNATIYDKNTTIDNLKDEIRIMRSGEDEDEED